LRRSCFILCGLSLLSPGSQIAQLTAFCPPRFGMTHRELLVCVGFPPPPVGLMTLPRSCRWSMFGLFFPLTLGAPICLPKLHWTAGSFMILACIHLCFFPLPQATPSSSHFEFTSLCGEIPRSSFLPPSRLRPSAYFPGFSRCCKKSFLLLSHLLLTLILPPHSFAPR